MNEVLKNLLLQPTAPFREGYVISYIETLLRHEDVPFFRDPWDNVVVGAKDSLEYEQKIESQTRTPLKYFIAHMDHPGFHGTSWNEDGSLQIRWLGGSPTQELNGAQVWLADRNNRRAIGSIRAAQLNHSGSALKFATVDLDSSSEVRALPASEYFGGFQFGCGVWDDGNTVYTNVADDLVGVFVVLMTAIELYKEKREGEDFLALLSRAEEVGFIGTIAHLRGGWLKKAKRPLVCVSIETSRTLPGAEIGKGPVLRLGDRYTIFDPASLRVAYEWLEKNFARRFQKRVMDGGTCEATAAIVFGIPSLGFSVPLGNYHNQSIEGGPNASGPMGPAPEFVDTRDVFTLVEVCRSLMSKDLPWDQPWSGQLAQIDQNMKDYESLLESIP